MGLTGRNTERKTWAQAHPTQGYLSALRMSGKKTTVPCPQALGRAGRLSQPAASALLTVAACALKLIRRESLHLPLSAGKQYDSASPRAVTGNHLILCALAPPSPRFYPSGLIVCNSYQVRLQSARAAPNNAVSQPSVCCQHFIGFQGGGLLFFSVILARQ